MIDFWREREGVAWSNKSGDQCTSAYRADGRSTAVGGSEVRGGRTGLPITERNWYMAKACHR